MQVTPFECYVFYVDVVVSFLKFLISIKLL